MSEPTPNCAGCNAPGFRHNLDCPHLTLEHARSHAHQSSDSEKHWLDRWRQQLREAQRWEGKFRVVKHENNQLRRKMEVLTQPVESNFQEKLNYVNQFIFRQPLPGGDIHQTTP